MITILFRDHGLLLNDVYENEDAALRNLRHYSDVVDLVEGTVTGREMRRLRKIHNVKGGVAQTCACNA